MSTTVDVPTDRFPSACGEKRGTTTGRRRHRAARELACSACRAADAAYRRQLTKAIDLTRINDVLAGVGRPPLTQNETMIVVDRLTHRGLSAAQVAEQIGCTQRTVVRYRRRIRDLGGVPEFPIRQPRLRQVGRDDLPAGRPVRVGGVVRWVAA